jgi:hypothetical protein
MHPFSIHFMSDTTTDMSLRRKYMLLFVSNRGPGTGKYLYLTFDFCKIYFILLANSIITKSNK